MDRNENKPTINILCNIFIHKIFVSIEKWQLIFFVLMSRIIYNIDYCHLNTNLNQKIKPIWLKLHFTVQNT